MRTQDKTRQNARPGTSKIWRFNGLAAAVAVALGGLAAVPGQAFAAAPNAGDNIGNIASADYTDATSTPRTVFSNPVNTTVRQVASFTLIDNRTTFVTPGGQVVYSHTLTNTGNGNDTFVLSAVDNGGTFNMQPGTVAIYKDANSDNIPDDAVDLNGTTIALSRGGVFNFVVVATAPTTATNGQINTVQVTADSQVYETALPASGNVDPADAINNDVATITSNAVITVAKSADVISGPTGTFVEYTLTYRNTGNNPATAVTLEDIIPDPFPGSATAGMDYVVNSGVWSNAPSTALTDANDSSVDPSGITYQYDSGLKKVIAVIDSVAPNVTGTLKFRVQVGSTTPPGVIPNVAQFSYDANGAAPGGNVGPLNSNTQNFTVLQTIAVAANDSTTLNTAGGNDDIADALDAGGTPISAGNPANPGDVVSFANEIWNNGNGTDTFNITLSGSTFPAGTTFQLYKSDGVTPLVTTDADSTADTGPLAAGARYTIIVKATLPSTVAPGTVGPFTVTKTATSITDGTSDTVTDRVTDFASATVDITNDAAAGAPGSLGDGPGSNTALHTTAINPGASTTFSVFVKNTSGIVDNYNLQSSADNTFATALPAGWSVVFHSGTCVGPVVVNTGNIAAGASAAFCAVVTSPAAAAPGTTDVYLRSVSSVSGASDYKVDAVTINTIHDIAIDTIGANQVAPSGTVTYTHHVTNLGNVTETNIPVSATPGGNNFPVTLYYDANNNNIIDGGEGVISTIPSLTPGQSINLIAVVSGPPGATDGQQDTTTLTATLGTDSNLTNNTTTDVTTVRYGQVRLVKEQALDANCDGAEDGAFTQAVMQAKPAECIVYRITATNEGSQPVTGVVLYDAIPTYTTLQVPTAPAVTGTAAGPFTFSPTSPSTDGATGTLTVSVGAMNGGQTAILKFGVQVDN